MGGGGRDSELPLSQAAAQGTHTSKSGPQQHRLLTRINTGYNTTLLWDAERSYRFMDSTSRWSACSGRLGTELPTSPVAQRHL